MTKPLNEQMTTLLQDVLDMRAPDLYERFVGSSHLSEEDRIAIIDVLTDELCDSGIDKVTSEPNQRGKLIEDVIGFFVRMSLSLQ